MGRIDAKTKEYVRRPEVFADLFNHLMYDGKQIVKPERLVELDPTNLAVLKDSDGKEYTIQKYRDVLKKAVVMEDEVASYLLIMGVENQLHIHYAMPVRNMLYDALNYSSQVTDIAKKHRNSKEKETSEEFLSGFHKEDHLIPVVTLVVYFGQHPWDGVMNLHSMFQEESRGIIKYVPDYWVNLIAPVSMTDEEIGKFKSDFKELAAYIKCGNDKEALKNLVENNEAYKHMDPLTASVASDVTNSKLKLKVNEKGEIDMCLAISEIREEGREEGRKEGRKEGREEGREEGMNLLCALIRRLKGLGRSEDMDRVLYDEAYRNELLDELEIR